MGWLDPSTIHRILSGSQPGVGPALVRAALSLGEPAYALATRWRNRRYDRHPSFVQRVAVPVVSVGNITTGGTGKTPLVAYLAAWFQQLGVQPAIVSRGYKARPGQENDEARELAAQLPQVPHVQNPDRVAGAQQAIDQHGAELILLDDGFQHRRLHRDLDIVLLDAVEPFGYEHVLPRGLLREPLAGLARADLLVLSRADVVDAARCRQIRQQAQRYAPEAGWMTVTHRPQCWRNAQGEQLPLDGLPGQRAVAFCGIGNPQGFAHTLAQCRVEVASLVPFADHHHYDASDFELLSRRARETGAKLLVCTGKDLVKLNASQLAGIPLWSLAIQLHVLEGQACLQSLLARVTRA